MEKKVWKAFDAAWYNRPGTEFATKEEAVAFAMERDLDKSVQIDEERRHVHYRGPVYL
jgi:hypothetical protein